MRADSALTAGPGTNSAVDDPFTSARTSWWRNDRFGMFIHFGAYSFLEGEYTRSDGTICRDAEWILDECSIPMAEYESFAQQFNPSQFSARAIMQLAMDAGQKYIVITSKHHDGYAMWPTKVNTWNLRDHSSFDKTRDILAELKAEAERQGVKLGFYYSIWDWHDPDFEANFPAYKTRMYAQLKELVDNYHPALLWFDGQWPSQWTLADGEELETYVRGLKPDLIINNRVGKRRVVDGDFETPEQEIPADQVEGQPWESCMTINGHWGFARYDTSWKSATTLTRNLLDIAGRSGNYLLNIVPDSLGRVPAGSAEQLRGMGSWLAANGQGAAVYGAGRPGVVADPSWGAVSRQGNKLYLSVYSWPGAGSPVHLQVHRAARTRPGVHRQVQLVALPAHRTPARVGHHTGTAGAIHRRALPVRGQPRPHPAELLGRTGRRPAQAVRSDVEQVVAAAPGDVEQVAGQRGGGLPVGVVAGEAPVTVDRHARLPRLPFDLVRGDLLFRRAEVAVDHPPLAHPVVDHEGRVERAQVLLQLLAVARGPVVRRVGGVPLAVEPQQRRVVVVDELLQLGVHPGLVRREVGLEVGVVPVPDRVVEAELDPLPVRLGLQLGQDIAGLVERRVVAQVPRVHLRRPHRIPVMVLRGDHDVLLTGVHGQLHDRPRAELRRVELLGEALVLGHRNAALVENPFRVPADRAVRPGVLALQERVRAEVDEHAEPVVAPPGRTGRGKRIIHGGVGTRTGRQRRVGSHDVNRGRRGDRGRSAPVARAARRASCCGGSRRSPWFASWSWNLNCLS